MKTPRLLAIVLGGLVATVGVGLVPSATAAPAAPSAPAAAAGTPYRAAPIDWGKCRDRDLRQAKARCGFLTVPLDHANPAGPTIQIAVSRVRHTKRRSLGAIFVNPGGPGGSGLGLATLGGAVPHGVGGYYDWYGIDPRGVGSSRPALSCDPKYANTQHQPYRPSTPAILDYWLTKTDGYAAACGVSAAKELLPHLKTTDNVADFEALRVAIGETQVSYYGFSYGTYIGQVWATLHPGSIKAMVLDGVVNSQRAWYQANLDQDYAFATVYEKFFRWVAKYPRIYHLGKSKKQVSKKVARLHAKLTRKPADGKIGSAEMEDVLLNAGYINLAWPDVATALSELANHKNTKPARQILRKPSGPGADNGNAVYLATECTDAPWPVDWNVWAADNTAADQASPYLAWGNAWFNAPCRHWPAPSNPAAFNVNGSAYTGPVLLISETFDAATPFSGALATRALFPTASLIEGKRGTTHAASLFGVSCVDNAVARLLKRGGLPGRKPGSGPDKTCPGLPAPRMGQQGGHRAAAPARVLPRTLGLLG